MKKRLLFMLGVLGLFTLALMVPGRVAVARDTGDLRAFAGNWGCTFNSPVSFFGPIAGLVTLNIDPAGKVIGHETVASADPFVLLEIEVSGSFSEGPNGTVNGTWTLTHPSFPTQTGKLRCVGTANRLGQFEVMSCLDMNDEPGGAGGGGPSTDSVSILRCERQ